MALKTVSSLRETTISYLPLRALLAPVPKPRTRHRDGSMELGRRKDRVIHMKENRRIISGRKSAVEWRMDALHRT